MKPPPDPGQQKSENYYANAAVSDAMADRSDCCVALAADALACQIATRVDLGRQRQENAALRGDLAKFVGMDSR